MHCIYSLTLPRTMIITCYLDNNMYVLITVKNIKQTFTEWSLSFVFGISMWICVYFVYVYYNILGKNIIFWYLHSKPAIAISILSKCEWSNLRCACDRALIKLNVFRISMPKCGMDWNGLNWFVGSLIGLNRVRPFSKPRKHLN